MPFLSEQQRQRAIEVMHEYLEALAGKKGESLAHSEDKLDKDRVSLIEGELGSLLDAYLSGSVQLEEFKSKVDGINKRNQLWGFKGIKGQMFFNMVLNVADDLDECDQELKAALTIPTNEQIASSRIKTFASYVKRLGDELAISGKDRRGCPRQSSIPFFLSYFWQIQGRDKWPVYYTTAVNTMGDLNLWQPTLDLAVDYIAFKNIHEELINLFTEAVGKPFDFYKVEHVFWYKGGNPFQLPKPNNGIKPPPEHPPKKLGREHLPDSYVPPIISILPLIANNEESLQEVAIRSGTTLVHAFEKNVNAAFTILGYETKLLGQGKGRVPDGLALALEDNYAILWDAKARANGYSMGTDDRTIREYITTQSRELKKRGALKNIYYLIVSSSFTDDYEDTIRSIKMETDVNEVTLVEAEALVAMVDAKLRDPLQVGLGPDSLQHLFSGTGVLTADIVREQLI